MVKEENEKKMAGFRSAGVGKTVRVLPTSDLLPVRLKTIGQYIDKRSWG